MSDIKKGRNWRIFLKCTQVIDQTKECGTHAQKEEQTVLKYWRRKWQTIFLLQKYYGCMSVIAMLLKLVPY